jgi:DNA polymerase I
MNFQNIPRDDKVVKRAFVPKRGAFSFFDYKQIEPRLTAYAAEKIGYPEFADQIRAGVGPYEAVARLATGKEELTEQERDTWKRVFLGILYGAGVKRVREVWMEESGEVITMAEAKKIVTTFKKNWPAIPALQRRILKAHEKRGYIIGLDGRHLHLEEYGEHKLLNKYIQGSAAGIMKQALRHVHRWQRSSEIESRMVSVIHDELIFDGPEIELPILHECVPPLMWRGFEHIHEVVPILVDHEVSVTTWADKIGYDEWAKYMPADWKETIGA